VLEQEQFAAAEAGGDHDHPVAEPCGEVLPPGR
jgi:hypothetical protein